MSWKITVLIGAMFFSTLTQGRTTDAVILSIKSASGGIGQTNAVDTGITIENGDIWIWGFRGSGLQGNGQIVVVETAPPARVNYFVQKKIKLVQAAAGIYHIIALDEHGDVWGWGQNGYAEAGGMVCTDGYVNSPCRILKGKNIVRIEAGEYMSYALSASGDVYTWGHGLYGQLASGNITPKQGVYKIPRSDFNNEPVVLLGSAYEGGYAITESGRVYAWGDDEDNAFGYSRNSAHVYVTKPLLLTNLAVSGKDITYICGGQPFTNYLTTSGEVYGMGGNFTLGVNKSTGKNAGPVLITRGYTVSSMYCRYSGSIAFADDAELITWGFYSSAFDIYGRTPTVRPYYDNITKIDGGKEHFIYWTDTGKAYGVGYGAGHKLSQGSNANVSFPGVQLSFLTNEMKKVYGKNYIPGQGL